MAQQLVYTSARRGLDPHAAGFCTVAATDGLGPRAIAVLERSSSFDTASSGGRGKDWMSLPPVLSHRYSRAVGGHVLSRIGPCGADYSGRSNFIAHHVILAPEELPPEGPAAFLAAFRFMDAWAGDPRTLEAPTLPRLDERGLSNCPTWGAAFGDAGWAGVWLDQLLASNGRGFRFQIPNGADALRLTREALHLLPPRERWRLAFAIGAAPEALDAPLDGQWVTGDAKRSRGRNQIIDLRDQAQPDASSALVCAARGEPTQATGTLSFEDLAPTADRAQAPYRQAGGRRSPLDIDPLESTDSSGRKSGAGSRPLGRLMIAGSLLSILIIGFQLWRQAQDDRSNIEAEQDGIPVQEPIRWHETDADRFQEILNQPGRKPSEDDGSQKPPKVKPVIRQPDPPSTEGVGEQAIPIGGGTSGDPKEPDQPEVPENVPENLPPDPDEGKQKDPEENVTPQPDGDETTSLPEPMPRESLLALIPDLEHSGEVHQVSRADWLHSAIDRCRILTYPHAGRPRGADAQIEFDGVLSRLALVTEGERKHVMFRGSDPPWSRKFTEVTEAFPPGGSIIEIGRDGSLDIVTENRSERRLMTFLALVHKRRRSTGEPFVCIPRVDPVEGEASNRPSFELLPDEFAGASAWKSRFGPSFVARVVPWHEPVGRGCVSVELHRALKDPPTWLVRKRTKPRVGEDGRLRLRTRGVASNLESALKKLRRQAKTMQDSRDSAIDDLDETNDKIASKIAELRESNRPPTSTEKRDLKTLRRRAELLKKKRDENHEDWMNVASDVRKTVDLARRPWLVVWSVDLGHDGLWPFVAVVLPPVGIHPDLIESLKERKLIP